MAEIVYNGYKRLFEVRVLHHYFLDKGAEDFEAPIPPQPNPDDKKKIEEERERRLARYDARNILKIEPTPTTEKRLKGLHSVFKATATGFLVAAPEGVIVPADARFEFVVTVQNADFFNYTALPFFKNEPTKSGRRQKIEEIIYQGKLYRYKHNVFTFTNVNDAMRGNRLFLSKEIKEVVVNTFYPVESIVRGGNLLRQYYSEQPPGSTHSLTNNYLDVPVFANQEDIHEAALPPGMAGVPPRGIALTDEMPDDTFALVQIEAMPPEPDFQLLNGSLFKSPVFEVHFKNRAAFWRYYDKSTKTFIEAAANQPRPLTLHGNATANMATPQAKPDILQPKAEIDNATGNVQKLYSEII